MERRTRPASPSMPLASAADRLTMSPPLTSGCCSSVVPQRRAMKELKFIARVSARSLLGDRSGATRSDLDGRSSIPAMMGQKDAFSSVCVPAFLHDARRDGPLEQHEMAALIKRHADGPISESESTGRAPQHSAASLGVRIRQLRSTGSQASESRVASLTAAGSRWSIYPTAGGHESPTLLALRRPTLVARTGPSTPAAAASWDAARRQSP